MTTQFSKSRKHLVLALSKQGEVDAAEAVLQEKRAGMYVHGVRAAIECKGDVELFDSVCEAVASEFRANKRGIAVKNGCDQAKDKAGQLKFTEEGNPIYKVPKGLSSMRSHLKKAMRYEIDLGSLTKPTPFSVARDAASAAQESETKAKLTGDDKIIAASAEVLESIQKRLAKLEGAPLKAAAKLIVNVSKAVEKIAA